MRSRLTAISPYVRGFSGRRSDEVAVLKSSKSFLLIGKDEDLNL